MNASKRFFSETTWTIETKLPMMADTARHRLTLDPKGKCSNAFFSESTNQIESKLDRDL
jgi:hypothetical protein